MFSFDIVHCRGREGGSSPWNQLHRPGQVSDQAPHQGGQRVRAAGKEPPAGQVLHRCPLQGSLRADVLLARQEDQQDT